MTKSRNFIQHIDKNILNYILIVVYLTDDENHNFTKINKSILTIIVTFDRE